MGEAVGETKDGVGSADHDMPFRWGRPLTVESPWPFHPLEFARLLILRGKLQDRKIARHINTDPDGIGD